MILCSEPTVAQPLSKLVAIARTASRGLQHPALGIIDLLRGLIAFGEAASALAGTPECEQEQQHRERGGAVAYRFFGLRERKRGND